YPTAKPEIRIVFVADVSDCRKCGGYVFRLAKMLASAAFMPLSLCLKFRLTNDINGVIITVRNIPERKYIK
ncbi:MAG: hypothetical protein IJ367_02695, partial [Clostridia bacterium]|nr:hypothetical protein [Clostridia bacterium]